MSPSQLSLKSDIAKLINEGYEVEIRSNYLLIHHVPYVNSEGGIQYGTLVSTLNVSADNLLPPETHVVSFIGDHPCHKDGSIMRQIVHQSSATRLEENLVVNHSFSNKPEGGYPDYYRKMSRYVEIISAPAEALDDSVKSKTFRVIQPFEEESVFFYLDTNSTRAEIAAISNKLKGLKIGIIGLGGTGSYLLDAVAKTPVAQIHIFEGDEFAQHNAFRSPGAASFEQLKEPPKKTKYFHEIYSKMHRGIIIHDAYLSEENVNELAGLDFVFVCVDKGKAKKIAVDFLEANQRIFIDVGMGLQVVDEKLIGLLRTTLSTPEDRLHLRAAVSFKEDEDDAYATNIQIAELNMLNASLAVIKWKKLCGFYQDMKKEHDTTYSINDNEVNNE